MTDPTPDETETETDEIPLLVDDPAEPDPDLTGHYTDAPVEVLQLGPNGLILEVYDDGRLAGSVYMSHLAALAEYTDDTWSISDVRRALEQYDPDD